MKIKVCGMKYSDNIKAVLELNIDYMGFIFYPPSSRFFDGDLSGINFKNTRKVGVFVNEDIEILRQKACQYRLNYVQLHGNEPVSYLQKLKQETFKTIKVFSVNQNFDFEVCRPYLPVADMFLFDTQGKLPGGNGIQFDWKILDKYNLNKPFLLSGGIGRQHAQQVIDFKHSQCIGVDVNSGFEIKSGLKDVEKLKKFIQQLSAF